MDYQRYLEEAISIFNEGMDADFSIGNIVLGYLTTANQKQEFERFCTKYFPYRLNDCYEEEGYFDFYATAFVPNEPEGKDGILLRTDISYAPAELIHVLLHELAHIFCLHNELSGASFYDTYCVGYADTSVEDGQINAGYGVWRECIAEIIARELDEGWDIPPLEQIKPMLAQLRQELVPIGGKLAMSQILVEVMTSAEVELAADWDTAKKHIERLGLFHAPTEMALMELVYKQLRGPFIPIKVDFISEIGFLYLETISMTMIEGFAQRFLEH
jgi:hypothetical protein